MAVISVDKLSKRYAGAAAPAVDDISFTVADREFMVLLGPSGCGKSTVLRMIAGLEPITSGTVSIDGRVMNQVPAKSRDIAMVFQSYALYPHMTVYDNLAFGLKRREVEPAEVARLADASEETSEELTGSGLCPSAVQEVESHEHSGDDRKNEEARFGAEWAAGQPIAAVKSGVQQTIRGKLAAVGPGVHEDESKVEGCVEANCEAEIAGAAKS